MTQPNGHSAAPHWLGRNSVPLMMRRTLLALAPALAVSVFLFGPAVLLNLALATLFCAALEAGMLRARDRPLGLFLGDGSVLVTAALLGLTLPPLLPWWVLLTACLFAVVVAKHLYGGLGYNVFNPAMVGYVAALVAFPRYVGDWPGLPANGWASLGDTLTYVVSGRANAVADALSGATPLDAVQLGLAEMRTLAEIRAGPGFGWLAGYGWEWLNLAALAGGLWLLRRQVIGWHAPGAMLGSLGLLYFLFWAAAPAVNPSPLFGLLSGGTMLAAFFVVTDPVSGAASNAGRIVFGAGTGVLCFVMRKWGAYPDGIAFAVLFMNMATPLIDRYTLPRVYGHRKRP